MTRISRRTVLQGAALTLAAPAVHAQQAVELKVVWMGWPENQVTPLMTGFEQRNPRIKLAVERIPFNQIFQTLEVRLNARNADPDIYICDSPLTASYAARGHLMELDSIIDRNLFSPSALAAASYNGKIYSAPFGSSMQLLFYNKALFREAGVEPPSADPARRWTWEQLVEAGRKLTNQQANRWGFVFEQTERPYQLLPFGQSLGGKALSDDGFRATGFLDQQPFVDGFTFMQRMYTDWRVSPPGVFDPNVPPEMFGTGRVAMLIAGTFHMDSLAQRYPNLEWGVAPHPYFANGRPVTPTGAWHIGANPRTQRREQVLTFMRDMLSEPVQIQWFGLRPYPPVLRSVWTSQAQTFNSDGWRITRHELDNTAIPRPATPGFREYEDVLRVALRDIQTGSDVRTALTQAAQRIDREMQKYR